MMKNESVFLKVFFIMAVIFMVSVMTGCPSSMGNGGAVGETGPITGYFIDSPVKGLNYRTSSGKEGKTDENGAFKYNEGEKIEFFIGKTGIGLAVKGKKVITPLTVTGAENYLGVSDNSKAALNLVKLLMSIDDKTNGGGMNISSDLDNLDISNFKDLLKNNVENLHTEIKKIKTDINALPNNSEVQQHLEISNAHINTIENSQTGDNLFITVKVPESLKGKRVQFHYHADAFTGSYASGKTIDVPENCIISFSEKLHKANWSLNLNYLSNSRTVSPGDLFCYYTPKGFSSTAVLGYPLDMKNGEVKSLQADFTNSSMVKTIQSDELFTVSGIIEVPKMLPDGTDLEKLSFGNIDKTLFVNMFKEAEGENGFASITMNPKVTNYEVKGNNLEIPYSFQLPKNVYYTLQGYAETKKRQGKNKYIIVPRIDSPRVHADNCENIRLTAQRGWELYTR
ncbi:hypothetical protein E4O05_02735 [Treponema sp. OMZ 787]|uniref:hypothetical protein n=1 Tax=Treponema sp. OMZ 787 TaxID=2563669 RepID=UPI0020A58BB7|nr:hypothetical protein [Treponema sp. OMZ 787]UTC62829.1 hypothetical protein E4O05_02735 [Treponema sp. OMZ 787]